MTRSLKAPLAAVALISIFVAQALCLARTSSTVSDEIAHIAAGYSYVKYGNLKVNAEHPPLVKQTAAIPLLFMDLKFPLESKAWTEGQGEQWELGRTFLFKLGNRAEQIIFAARAALVPFMVLLGLTLFFWVRRLFGDASAVFAVFAFAFIPDLIAHSSLVTTDFAGAAFHFLTFYFLYLFHQNGKAKFLAAAGIAGGLALISKFSMMQILPLFYAAGFFISFYSPAKLPSVRFPFWLLGIITLFTVIERVSLQIFLVPLLFAWLCFFFPKDRFFRNEKVNRAMAITLVLLSLAFLVVVVDYFEITYWFQKFRPLRRFCRGWAIFRDHAVELQHPGYFFGTLSSLGWKQYYAVAMLVKIPLAVWVFAGFGVLAAFFRKWTCKAEWFFLGIPPLIFFFIASFINKVNIGVRHVLPFYPYLIVLAAAGFYLLWEKAPKLPGRGLALALCAWLCISTLSAFPNYLSYFNEAAQIWGGGEKILSDSNISWGQDLKRLKKYVDENGITEIKTQLIFNFPEELDYYKLPWKDGEDDLRNKRPGIYAIDVFNYQRLIKQTGYEWLKTRKPDAKAGGSIWIFRL